MARFKLELTVEDKGETARIVFWDAHCKELIGQTAAALRQEMIDVNFFFITSNIMFNILDMLALSILCVF